MTRCWNRWRQQPIGNCLVLATMNASTEWQGDRCQLLRTVMTVLDGNHRGYPALVWSPAGLWSPHGNRTVAAGGRFRLQILLRDLNCVFADEMNKAVSNIGPQALGSLRHDILLCEHRMPALYMGRGGLLGK